MTKHFPVLARTAALALLAGAGIAGAAKADGARYHEDESATITYRHAPTPRTYYHGAPVYSSRSHTTYYYVPSEPAVVTRRHYHAPRSEPYYYVPAGLSLTTPLGVYAPFYGGYASHGSESDGGRSGYRLGY